MGMRWVTVLGVGVMASVLAQPVFAKDIMVNMLTKGPTGLYVFEPAFVKADVGDKVHFKPADPSHNAETIAGMLPSGIAPMKGLIGKEMVLTVSKPGIYGVQCLPHASMGMVAVVQAGKGPSANLGSAKAVRLPPLAQKRITPLLAKAS